MRCSRPGRTCVPAIGTHNPRSVAQAIVKARAARRSERRTSSFRRCMAWRRACERRSPRPAIRTRVYTPVGEVIPGMAYLVRRLLENTSNQAWFNAGVTLACCAGAAARRSGWPSAKQMAFRNAAPAAFFEPDVHGSAWMRRWPARAVALAPRTRCLSVASRVSDRLDAEVRYPGGPEAS